MTPQTLIYLTKVFWTKFLERNSSQKINLKQLCQNPNPTRTWQKCTLNKKQDDACQASDEPKTIRGHHKIWVNRDFCIFWSIDLEQLDASFGCFFEGFGKYVEDKDAAKDVLKWPYFVNRYFYHNGRLFESSTSKQNIKSKKKNMKMSTPPLF